MKRSILLVVVMVAGCIALAASGETSTDQGGNGGAPSGGDEQYPPMKDVALDDCSANELGWAEAAVSVTNNSPEKSDYVIEVAFESQDGSTQFGTGTGIVSGLEPGQNAVEDISSVDEAVSGSVCRVVSVDRNKSY